MGSLSFHRFTAEEKAKRHPCAYLPFGLGPRNCIGMRFALMEAKMALIEIVRNFKILRLPETKVFIDNYIHNRHWYTKHTHAHTNTCTRTHTRTHTRTGVHIHTHAHTHMYTYSYTYSYTHTHTHTHTHIHMNFNILRYTCTLNTAFISHLHNT